MAEADVRPWSDTIDRTPTYHTDKDSRYLIPNDSPEHVRLETQARHLSAIMNGRIIHAPLERSNVKRILDVGCGTGIVTDYLGRRYPHAEAIGLDLSAVPDLRDRPSNVRFLRGNFVTEKPSTWLPDNRETANYASEQSLPDNPAFDLIYSRLLLCGMNNWPAFISAESSLLRPEGWAEVHDLDWIWYDKSGEVISDAWPWQCRLRAAADSHGMDWSCGSRAKQWMEDAGFEDVQVKTYRWPYGGDWEKNEVMREFGEYVRTAMVELLWHVISRLMDDQPDGTPEVIDQMRQEMKKDFRPEEGKHWLFYVTWGRKPAQG